MVAAFSSNHERKKNHLFFLSFFLSLFPHITALSNQSKLHCKYTTMIFPFFFVHLSFSFSFSGCKHVCLVVLFTSHDASCGGGGWRRGHEQEQRGGDTLVHLLSSGTTGEGWRVWARQVQLAAFTPRSKIIIRFRLVLFPLGRRQDPQPGTRQAQLPSPPNGAFRKALIVVEVLLKRIYRRTCTYMHTNTRTHVACNKCSAGWAEAVASVMREDRWMVE